MIGWFVQTALFLYKISKNCPRFTTNYIQKHINTRNTSLLYVYTYKTPIFAIFIAIAYN